MKSLKKAVKETIMAASTNCSTTAPSSTHDLYWQSANAHAISYPRDEGTVHKAVKLK